MITWFSRRSSFRKEKPLRDQILSREAIAQYAADLAERTPFAKAKISGVPLKQRFRENYRLLERAYYAFAESAREKEMLTAGAEWILDNYHVIDEQVRDIKRDLPRSYYKALPKLSDQEWHGYPRVYRLACEYIAHTDGIVETDLLTIFIDAYQAAYQPTSILRIGEIWAIPIMLRLALVENLRRLAEASLASREARREVERFCEETIDPAGSAGTEMLIGLANRIGDFPNILETGSAHLLRRLRAKGTPAALAVQWVDEKLREKGLDPSELLRQEQQSQAADQISVGNSITALKTIGALNWREWFERVSYVDQILKKDPSGIYEKSDFITRDTYRHTIERVAEQSRRSEVEMSEEVVKLATEQQRTSADAQTIRESHVGYYLIDQGLSSFFQRISLKENFLRSLLRFLNYRAFFLYISAVMLLTIFGTCLAFQYNYQHGGSWLGSFLLAVLFVFPLSEFAIQLVQWIATKFVSPKPLPKLDLEKAVPDELKTVVTIQTICADREALDKTIESLEIRFIGNEDKNVYFTILADLADAPREIMPGDRGIISHATERIEDLNRRYSEPNNPRFFVLFRRRLWNAYEEKFMGWERKRGKLMEFNRLLRGATDTTFQTNTADLLVLRACRYVITLDNDTQLPAGAAKKLIGTIAHPLNQAIIDPELQVVVNGYGLIQPRIGITLQSGLASIFSLVFSGHSGLDPYTRTVSDVYQDLFKEGSYIGKGIYEVDVFEKVLHDRVPENTLLSHDLFEGLFVRTGLASDIELFDEFPTRYHAHARRQHRWIRGDWQLLPWVLKPFRGQNVPPQAFQRCSVPTLGRWKLVDNLRRSLVAPALFFALISIWSFGRGSQLWSLLFLILLLAFPVLSVFVGLILDLPFGLSLSSYFRGFFRDLKRSVQQVLLHLVFLPHQSLFSLHAIGITLYRVLISKRHLLEWETAYAAERRLSGAVESFLRMMFPAILLTLGAQAALALTAKESSILTMPFFLAWYLAPVLAWRVSQPIGKKLESLSSSDTRYLKKVAFQTWKYFDAFLIPEYNYLIPDNLQVVPRRIVAERTSPTNISLSVLSVISAYDLGFIPLTGVLERLSGTMEALKKLERFHGHFLNWYEIRQLRSLPPRYISAVDSGNLFGHFIAAKEALKKYPHLPLISTEHLDFISDYISQALRSSQPSERAASLVLGEDLFPRSTNLESFLDVLNKIELVKRKLDDFGAAKELSNELGEIGKLRELIEWLKYLPLIERLGERGAIPKRLKNVSLILKTRAPTLALLFKLTNRLLKNEAVIDITKLDAEERSQFDLFQQALHSAHDRLQTLSSTLNDLIEGFEHFVEEADFAFLFDAKKKLFVIGYNIDNGHRDNGYYDLLASEARLASIVAIAKGDIPQSHWFVLNRGLTDSPGGKALLSWSATMFEYLMPILVMKDFPGTLLSDTYRAVVKTQQSYAKRRGVPWGISESAYSGVDFEKTYQYRAFGIPGLGLKRGLGDDLVVSPYSTMLALPIDPVRAVKNLKRLEASEVWGEFGFYEAVDFTPERLSAEENSHVVRSFLAHHQGMSLISIANFLKGDIHQERFHSDPSIKACELLLQERFPTRIPVIVPHQAELSYLEREEITSRAERSEHLRTPHTPVPRIRVLSNGRYSVILDNAGSGGSFLDGNTMLSRWREDGVSNNYGTYIYVRDRQSDDLWSVTYQPTRVEPEEYEVIFNPDKVEYRRRNFGISIHTEITVSPEDNVEIRRLTLSNVGAKQRTLDLTSFGEVALASRQADIAHPAFSKMFIESEFLEDYDALVFARRPRSEKEQKLYLVHLVTMPVVWAPVQYQTTRGSFLGRGRGVSNPLALSPEANLTPYARTQRVGTVLDPIFSLSTRVEIEPSGSQTLSFITGIAFSREEALALIAKYRESPRVVRAFELAWSQSDVELRHQQFSIAQTHAFQKLANAVLYNVLALRAPSDLIRRNRLSQSGLWRFGLSGDDPIVVVVLTDPEHATLAHELLIAHEYLRLRGVRFDLVMINEYPGGYMQNFQQELELLLRSGYSRDFIEKRGGVYLRVASQLSEEELTLLHSVARVVLHGTKGSLSDQLNFDSEVESIWLKKEQSPPEIDLLKAESEPLEFSNGIGGFSKDGKAYTIIAKADAVPPQPWSNVIANKRFGFLVTESGGGYTWAENSRENRISPWTNDPVTDPCGEALYIRDIESGLFWSPTPRPASQGQSVKVVHGFGYSEFATQLEQISSVVTISGSSEEKVKWWHLELSNQDDTERRLEIFLYFEWVLGVTRDDSYRSIVSGFEPEAKMLYAHNPFNIDFSSQIIFLGSNQDPEGYTCDRMEFIGRHGDTGNPIAFQKGLGAATLGKILSGGRSHGVKLSGATGGGFDTCAVMKISLRLAAGEKREALFYMGQADSVPHAKNLSSKYRSIKYRNNELEQVKHWWDSITGAVQVRTPNRAFDILTNGWLLYQTLSCRINGRSGLYQSSGALGFRDQLQDSMALLLTKPEDTKRQILLHASRQFGEGDVQHWWHPPAGKGIRTKISDNYIWLPYAVLEYLRITNDQSILDERVGFIEGPPLDSHEMESYQTPRISDQDAPLYDHCVIALDRALNVSPRGLPFMGAGDWNDGFNQVGVKGKGESVWLGWFLADTLTRFAELVEAHKDMYRANEYRSKAKQIISSIEENSWDGKWYHRAYFDDGTPIGSEKNTECKIDSLSQSWCVISGLGDPARGRQAMDQVYEHLVKPDDGIICLLWPPFNVSEPNPGYIRGYPPGLRENGGQYTHAATWVVMASAVLGQGQKAFELFDYLNPILHTHTSEGIARYQTEPYVTCGDVYSVAPHNGRGGWSWYTGSSGWLYRVAIEYLIGLKVRGDYFTIEPCIPPHWREFSVDFRHKSTLFKIRAINPALVQHGVTAILVNERQVHDMKVSLTQDSPEVRVDVIMG